MDYPLTGIILAGGENKRFDGKEKALCELDGRPILDYIYQQLKDLCHELILITNHPEKYLDWNLTIMTDLFPQRSSMNSIYSALTYCSTTHAFVTACDTPLIKKELISKLAEYIDPRFDAVIPSTPSGLEPLCAIYTAECKTNFGLALEQEKLKIIPALPQTRIKYITAKSFLEIDPDFDSFFNINHPQDLIEAEKRLSRLNPVKKTH